HNSEWVDDPEGARSRPGSRRNSGPFSRRSSIKKEPEGKKNTPPNSSSSTPKKIHKPLNPDFVVTGKPLLKKLDLHLYTSCFQKETASIMQPQNEQHSETSFSYYCMHKTPRARLTSHPIHIHKIQILSSHSSSY
ncbi:jg8596, partial [Pararge aegeria aegeria]